MNIVTLSKLAKLGRFISECQKTMSIDNFKNIKSATEELTNDAINKYINEKCKITYLINLINIFIDKLIISKDDNSRSIYRFILKIILNKYADYKHLFNGIKDNIFHNEPKIYYIIFSDIQKYILMQKKLLQDTKNIKFQLITIDENYLSNTQNEVNSLINDIKNILIDAETNQNNEAIYNSVGLNINEINNEKLINKIDRILVKIEQKKTNLNLKKFSKTYTF